MNQVTSIFVLLFYIVFYRYYELKKSLTYDKYKWIYICEGIRLRQTYGDW